MELSSCEETQALALRVILSLTKYNQQRIHELENCNGLSMIHQVLIKQKCIVGFHVLKVCPHKIHSYSYALFICNDTSLFISLPTIEFCVSVIPEENEGNSTVYI